MTQDPPRYGEVAAHSADGGGPPRADSLASGPLHHAAPRRGPPPRSGKDCPCPLPSPNRHAELVSASTAPQTTKPLAETWILKQAQGDGGVCNWADSGRLGGSNLRRWYRLWTQFSPQPPSQVSLVFGDEGRTFGGRETAESGLNVALHSSTSQIAFGHFQLRAAITGYRHPLPPSKHLPPLLSLAIKDGNVRSSDCTTVLPRRALVKPHRDGLIGRYAGASVEKIGKS